MGWAGESCPVTQPKVGPEGHQTASLVLNSNLRMKRDVVRFLLFRSARVAERYTAVGRTGAFHKRTFADGLCADGKSSHFSFHNPLSIPTRKAMAI
jgi:hypothetical protein